MRKALLALCVMVPLYMPTVASAEGNWLLNLCESNRPEHMGMCFGYIHAFSEGFQFGQADMAAERSRNTAPIPLRYCIPEGVTGQQLRDIVVRFLRQNPEHRHIWYGQLIMWSLSRTYPCGSRR